MKQVHRVRNNVPMNFRLRDTMERHVLTDLFSQCFCLVLCQETDIITQNDADDDANSMSFHLYSRHLMC